MAKFSAVATQDKNVTAFAGGGASVQPKSQEDLDAEAAMAALEDDSLDGSGGLYAVKDDTGVSTEVFDPSVATKKASEMTDAELAAAQKALYERETSLFTKTEQKGKTTTEDENGKRLDEQALEKGGEAFGGKLTKGEKKNTIHYEGELGTFDYDTKNWALGEKTVKDKTSGVETTIPILKYIGDKKAGNDIKIPEGITSIDYMFEDNDKLETVPVIPEGVKSAHDAFRDCDKITRACKDAKIDEKDMTGTTTGLAAGATAVAATAGTFGAVNGWNPLGWAAFGVSAIAAGVGIAANHFAKDGKGGTWKMPDSLEDASEMFSGCENLTEAYQKAGSHLKNTRGMYKDNVSLGTDKIANKYGSVAVTNAKDSGQVSKEAAQGTYDGVNDDVRRSLTETVSKDGKHSIGWSDKWDEDTQTFNDPEATPEEKATVEQGSQTLKEKDAREGEPTGEMFQQTGGLAAYNHVYKKDIGYVKTEDVNEKSDEKPGSSFGFDLGGLGGIGSLLDRAAVSVGEFWILKKLTKNSLVAGVATFGLQAINILPKSIKPVLNTVTNFVGKDSGVGQFLSGVSDKIPDQENAGGVLQIFDGSSGKTAQAAGADISDRVQADMSAVQTATTAQSNVDISATMYQNGKTVAKDGVLLDVATKQPGDPELSDVTTMSLSMAAGLEQKAIQMAGGENGELSEQDKKILSQRCMNIMNGLNAYQQGAMEQITATYGASDKNGQAQVGLNNVMHATATPLMDAVKDMDNVYHFLSEEDKQKLGSMSFGGVSYNDYQVGSIETEAAKSPEQLNAEIAAKQAEVEGQALASDISKAAQEPAKTSTKTAETKSAAKTTTASKTTKGTTPKHREGSALGAEIIANSEAGAEYQPDAL